MTFNNFSTNDFSTKEKTLYWLTAGFFITLLLPGAPVINNIFVAGVFVYAWFYNKPTEKWRILGQRKEIVFMLLFYLLHIVSALLSNNREEAFRLLVLRLPLLVFPLSFGLLFVRTAVKDRIIQAYGAAVSLGALICTLYAGIRYARTGDGVYLYNDSLTEVLDIQSSYYALMVLLAVAGFIYLLGKGYFSGKKGIYVRGGIVLLLIFHFMLASRISITILYRGLLIVLGAYVVRHRKRALALWLVLGLVAALGLCMKLLPKTMNRFRELEYPSYSFTRVAPESHYNGTLTPDQWNGANIRLAIWKCGWEVASRHWLTGVQLGDKQDSLMGMYKKNGFTFALERKRNFHNNYLDIFCAFGAVGIVLFLLGYLVIPLWKAVRTRDMLGLALLLAMGVSMAVESYFDRSLGCLVMGFFFSFIAATREPRAVT
ncbi:MAG TPA: O-antigen ligase family protein [Puia sp.]